MEKTLTVTIKVEKDKPTRIEFLEPESGTTKVFNIGKQWMGTAVAADLGHEILSWVSLMEDELENETEK